MAQITLTIPDAVAPRVVDAIAVLRGYNPATDGTKTQFAKRHLIDYIKRMLWEHEGRIDSDVALLAKKAEAEALDIT